jgi:hypothetical protein
MRASQNTGLKLNQALLMTFLKICGRKYRFYLTEFVSYNLRNVNCRHIYILPCRGYAEFAGMFMIHLRTERHAQLRHLINHRHQTPN